ncbi:Cytochrome P450 [Senna tora]|uniref:Cytochrome P450 n=1 Tax=Senna tora TaxID=362788 RepID=A0A834X567_9FABA|nr:Cytochrome P450 [Senna tora]
MTPESVLKHSPFELNASFCLIITILLIISVLFKLTTRRRSKKSKVVVPPSPPKLPFIGNLHQLGKLPHRSFQALSHKYGPLMLLHLGQIPTLVVSSPDIAREIAKSHDVVFSSRPQTTAAKIFLYGCKDVGFAPYGEEWKQKRKICVVELLSLKRVQSFQFIRKEEVEEMVNKIREACESESEINLSQMFITTSNNIVSRCVLGHKYEAAHGSTSFGDVARKVMTQFVAFSVGDFFPSLGWIDYVTGLIPKLKATSAELDAFFEDVIEQHKMMERNYEDDFVDILLQLPQNGKLESSLTISSKQSYCDTNSTTLEWAMAELLRNPTTMKKAQEEVRRVVHNKSNIDEKDVEQMKYLECVVKETLRLHPPAPLMLPRETSSGVKLRGYDIPPKTSVYINVWAIQRDPEIWERPEEFVPERFENSEVDFKGQHFQLIPFGIGRRGCPGVSFGIVVVEYILANLLYWFDWKLPGGEIKMASILSLLKQLPFHQNITLFSSLFCFIIPLFLIKLIDSRRRTKSSQFINLPPSPPKLPFIGNLHQLGSLPHRSFRSLSQKYGPIMFLQLGQSPTVVLSSPEFASQVMKTHDLAFADRPQGTAPKILLYGCTDVAFGLYGEMWREKKKICVNEFLSQKRVQSFKEIREAEVGELVNKIRDMISLGSKCVNLSELLIATSNDIVSKCVLGDKFNRDGRLPKLTRKVMIKLGAVSVGDYFPSLGWIDVVTGFIPKVIEEHRMRVKKGESFVDILLQLQENGLLHNDFTQDDFKTMLMDMVVGGTEPSSTALQWGMAELMRNPTKMKKAQEEVRRVVGSKSKVDESDISEMKYLKCVVKEILRLHPSAPLVAPRVSKSSVEINGYTIPANTTVYINSWAIQRDPEFWERPEEFLPERFEKNVDFDFKGQNFRYIPFGSGRRVCPGIMFGIAYVECILANLLYWFDWKLPTDGANSVQDIDMSESFGLTVTMKVPFCLHATPYSFGSFIIRN